MRQKRDESGWGESPRSLVPVDQERADLDLPQERDGFAPYRSFSYPGFRIDEFPTAPMPLFTIEAWPTQPLPKVTGHTPLSSARMAPENLSGDELAIWFPPEIAPSDIEAHTKPQPSVATSTSYIEMARNLAKSSGIYALAALGSPLVSLVLAPFLTYHLSPTDYGILAVLTTVISLVAGITQLGLGSAFFRAYSYEYTEPHEQRAVLATIIVLLPLISIPVAIVATIFSPALAGALLGRPSLGGLIILVAWIVVLQNLTVPGFAWLRAENRPLFFSLLSISNILIVLCTNLVLLGLLHWGVEGSLVATGSGYAMVALCTLPIILWRARWHMRTDIAWSMLAFGSPLVLSYISYWVLQVSDRYLLSLFVSLAQTASYAVAYSLGSVLSTLVISPFSLAWPAAMFSIAKRKDAPQIFQIVFRGFSMILLFVAFALSIAASLLLDWLFPKQYHSAASIIPIIAESMVFFGLYSVFMTGASIQRKTWIHALFTTMAALVNFAVNLVLIPRFGAEGAAASTLIAYIMLALAAYLANQRIYPIPYQMGRFLLALLTGVALYIAAEVISFGWNAFWRWSLTFSCLILYGAILLFLGGGMRYLRNNGVSLITRIFSDRRVS